MKKKSVNKKPIFSKFIYSALILIVGMAGGYLLGFLTTRPTNKDIQDLSEIRAGRYQFTNPLLDCDNFHPSVLKNHVRLKNNLNDYVNNALKTGISDHISVYFRLLNNGPWIGINEKYYFTPASLLKAPILIAILKKAEADTTLLNKKILYDKVLENTYSPNIADNENIKTGNTYTVDKLLEYMIIHSDNNAKAILLNLIGDDYLLNVMTDLGVNLRNRDLSIDFLSVKEYSSFFRIMYNASYLNRDMSEKALKILSKTKFNKGIPDKLPKNILVAHKFGERGFENSNEKQLHNCGIVYVPDSPYLLCIMTKGTDFNNLTKVISDISEIVYNSVSK